MIRDLQEEVRQLRNLAEATAYAVEMIADKLDRKEILEKEDVTKSLITQHQKYQKHRCDRFDQEVEDAEAVLEKNYRCCGYDMPVGTFVPRKWWDELQDAYTDLKHEYKVLTEEINLLKKKIKKGSKSCQKKT